LLFFWCFFDSCSLQEARGEGEVWGGGGGGGGGGGTPVGANFTGHVYRRREIILGYPGQMLVLDPNKAFDLVYTVMAIYLPLEPMLFC